MSSSRLPIGAVLVVPYVGTWIEIISKEKYGGDVMGRSLRGNVDRNYPDIERTQSVILSFPTWERG